MKIKWRKAVAGRIAAREDRARSHPSDSPARVRVSRSTFREDPLPDRRMRDRGVTLPKLKCLEPKEKPAPSSDPGGG